MQELITIENEANRINEDTVDIAMVPYRYEYLLNYTSGYQRDGPPKCFNKTRTINEHIDKSNTYIAPYVNPNVVRGRVCRIHSGTMCRFCGDDEKTENDLIR